MHMYTQQTGEPGFSPNVGTILVQHHRRGVNILRTMGECLVFAGYIRFQTFFRSMEISLDLIINSFW